MQKVKNSKQKAKLWKKISNADIDVFFPRCVGIKTEKRDQSYLTFVAQTKHVVTTFEITFIKFLVSCITLSTFVKVAAFPTVGFFTVNWSCWTYVGTRSKFSKSSFLCGPPGTCIHTTSYTNLRLLTVSQGKRARELFFNDFLNVAKKKKKMFWYKNV